MCSRYRGHYLTVNLHPTASGHVSQEHGYLFLKSPVKTDVNSEIRLCTPQGERKGYIQCSQEDSTFWVFQLLKREKRNSERQTRKWQRGAGRTQTNIWWLSWSLEQFLLYQEGHGHLPISWYGTRDTGVRKQTLKPGPNWNKTFK